ncbi:TPA: isopentenyl phosphate kinase family protein [Candidatus Micrarchaeota archaeon]|nr:isopentenyl phosphate kinase family protein [Candidatus Micrarchaeota archaeon]
MHPVGGETVFVKWGGAVITDKTAVRSARRDVIRRLAEELKPLLSEYRIILGHGSGSFGHWAARTFENLRKDSPELYAAKVHAVAAELNQIVTEILVESGIPAFQFPPSAIMFSRGDYVSRLCLGVLTEVLQGGYLPVIYGDAVPDGTLGGTIFSTERVFFTLNPILKPRRIVLITTVDGVYTADPLRDPDAERIPEITPENFPEVQEALGEGHGTDVTGGMLSKVETMLAAVQSSPWLESVVITSAEPGRIERAVRGEKVGTVIHR